MGQEGSLKLKVLRSTRRYETKVRNVPTRLTGRTTGGRSGVVGERECGEMPGLRAAPLAFESLLPLTTYTTSGKPRTPPESNNHDLRGSFDAQFYI